MWLTAPGCVKIQVFSRDLRQGDTGAVLGADCFHQSANAQNTHDPFRIVGHDVQRHFGTDVLECIHGSAWPHPGLYRTEGMLRLAAQPHFHWVSIKPCLHGLKNRFVLPS